MAEPRKMSESPLLAADYPDRPERALRARDREAAGWPMACVRIRWCPINPWSIKKDDLKALVPEGASKVQEDGSRSSVRRIRKTRIGGSVWEMCQKAI